jgi:hypothetical protein
MYHRRRRITIFFDRELAVSVQHALLAGNTGLKQDANNPNKDKFVKEEEFRAAVVLRSAK